MISLEDMVDMLESECLFDDEFSEFFLRLPKMQIILLLKYIDEYGQNREWHEKFFEFVNNLPEEDINYINSIKEQLRLI